MKQESGRIRRQWFRTFLRGAMLLVVPVAAIVIGLIGHHRHMKSVSGRQVMFDTMAMSGEPVSGRVDGLGALALPRRVEDWVLLHPADLPLAGEPMNLPPFPGAVRETGFRRRVGSFEEDFSVWEIPRAELDDVVRHYNHAAGAVGLQPSGSVPKPRSRNTVYQMFVGGTDRSTVLVVRVSRRGSVMRVVLWRRCSVFSNQYSCR